MCPTSDPQEQLKKKPKEVDGQINPGDLELPLTQFPFSLGIHVDIR